MDPNELCLNFGEVTPEQVTINASFHPEAKDYEIFFRSHNIALARNTETLLAVGLLPAMKTNSTIVAEGFISQSLLNSLDHISHFFCRLNPSLQRVPIKHVIPEPKKPPQENRVGTFFSGGIDSFYTFLKHQDEITDLIFIHGYDIPLGEHSRLSKAAEVIQKIGAQWGKRVIEVETNLFPFLDLYVPRLHSFGLCLVSVGHLLFPSFRRIYIPASHDFAHVDSDLFGSHPESDPLWSTEALEFVHDGCEATRIDKATLIGKSDLALQSLRVCFETPESALNCGGCEKCIRTMINLHIAGALDRCTTFAAPLDYKRVARILIINNTTRAFVDENLTALANRPADRELYNALRKALKRAWWLKPRVYAILRWIYRALKKLTAPFR